MIDGLSFWGLTGGIGSGKSTVAALIRQAGVPVLDADQIARAVTSPGHPALAEIARSFPDAIAPDGTLDRKRLGARVFADPTARKILEAITHPRIQARALEEAGLLAAAGHPLAFYEASLLVETGRHRDFDGLVVVTAPPEVQLGRVMARDGLDEAAARARLAAQLPLADKVRLASHVIDNGGDRAATERAVKDLLAKLR